MSKAAGAFSEERAAKFIQSKKCYVIEDLKAVTGFMKALKISENKAYAMLETQIENAKALRKV
jgi:hypothetical protein